MIAYSDDIPLGPDDYDDFEDECSNCMGEGVVYDCDEPFACIDPEGGCDLCMRRCDWCNSPKRPPRDPSARSSDRRCVTCRASGQPTSVSPPTQDTGEVSR